MGQCEGVRLGAGGVTFELETDLVESLRDEMTTAATSIHKFTLRNKVKLNVSGTALGKLLPLFKVVRLWSKDLLEEHWAAWATCLYTRVKEEGREAAQSVELYGVDLRKVSSQTLDTLLSSMKKIELRWSTKISADGWKSFTGAIEEKYNAGEGVLEEFDTDELDRKDDYKEYIVRINRCLV